jgi:hypothetical protein
MAESVSNQGVARKKCYNGISRKNITHDRTPHFATMNSNAILEKIS